MVWTAAVVVREGSGWAELVQLRGNTAAGHQGAVSSSFSADGVPVFCTSQSNKGCSEWRQQD